MLRRWLYEVLEGGAARADARIFDGFMVALILANVVAVVLESVPVIHDRYATAFAIFDDVSLGIFAIEYIGRLWAGIEIPQVRHRGPWRGRLLFALRPSMLIDLLALSPLVFHLVLSDADLRVLRVFRLLRFLKLARFSPALNTMTRAIYEERRALLAAVILMLGTAVFSGALMHLVEPDNFPTIPHGMWWALATLTTIGYGDAVPLTWQGKLFGGFVMVFGLGLFALPIGIIATAFVNEIHRRDFVVTWGMVARVPLFASLDAASIAEIMKIMRTRTVGAGTTITEAGEEADGMYFISDGEVQVKMRRREIVLKAGDFFGEIALLKKVRRFATTIAHTRCQLMVIEAGDFDRLMSRDANLRSQVAAIVDQRLAGEWAESVRDTAEDEIEARSAETRKRSEAAAEDW